LFDVLERDDFLATFKALIKSAWAKREGGKEPSREALAAFGFFKAARVAWLPVSPSRSARAQALR